MTSIGSRFAGNSNGNAPVSRKYIVAPMLNTSLTGFTYLKLMICSGGMKTGVPAVLPVMLTGLLTLGTCVVIGQPINFANIIALPLLFGIGVAFHIYLVMAWRSGEAHFLTSSLTRAVLFSGLTTGIAFGALWISAHPGTASMGKLLLISLAYTLGTAMFFGPALMGEPPRDTAPPVEM